MNFIRRMKNGHMTLYLFVGGFAFLLVAANVTADYSDNLTVTGALVSAEHAGDVNVYQFISGERVLYFEISNVLYSGNDGWAKLNNLLSNRLNVIGEGEIFQKLAQMDTCYPFTLYIRLYSSSDSVVIRSLDNDDNTIAKNNTEVRSCKVQSCG